MKGSDEKDNARVLLLKSIPVTGNDGVGRPLQSANLIVVADGRLAPSPETKTAEAKPEVSNEKAGTAAGGLKPVYFDFDKSFIRDDARAVMRANAGWLKANPKTKIRIEGNCDERGTIEYNQPLGQRRAARAKKYLADMGISGHRISLISYGREKSI